MIIFVPGPAPATPHSLLWTPLELMAMSVALAGLWIRPPTRSLAPESWSVEGAAGTSSESGGPGGSLALSRQEVAVCWVLQAFGLLSMMIGLWQFQALYFREARGTHFLGSLLTFSLYIAQGLLERRQGRLL